MPRDIGIVAHVRVVEVGDFPVPIIDTIHVDRVQRRQSRHPESKFVRRGTGNNSRSNRITEIYRESGRIKR